ncbi:MAG TPA: hypothetical protein VIP80_01615 [Gemmatimonadales bacterium]
MELRIREGACRPLFCFEVGFSIDLEAAKRMTTGAERLTLQHREHAGLFELRPPPLCISERAASAVAPFPLGPVVELVLYDFGAASVSYSIPLTESAAELLELSRAVRGHAGLLADARQRITRLVESLGSAVERPKIAEAVEDYFIFQLTRLEGAPDAASLCADHAELLARVLRAESSEISGEEIADAIEARISFGRHEVALVDWDSALLIGPEPEELRAVLEFANVQLLELRYLDGDLDRTLERSYQLLARRTGWRSLSPASFSEGARLVSTLQLESAVLLERVTNALKFLGEEYLARLYRLTATRLHLGDWAAAITRKLQTVENIYETMSSRASTRRMELLEWVVIVLIALEIVLGLAR